MLISILNVTCCPKTHTLAQNVHCIDVAMLKLFNQAGKKLELQNTTMIQWSHNNSTNKHYSSISLLLEHLQVKRENCINNPLTILPWKEGSFTSRVSRVPNCLWYLKGYLHYM